MSPSLSNQVLDLINPNQFSSTHSGLGLAQPWLTLRRCQPKMTACATSPPPTPHLDRVPPAAGPAGGGGCCTGGGPPHGGLPAALPPPASGSRAGRPRRP